MRAAEKAARSAFRPDGIASITGPVSSMVVLDTVQVETERGLSVPPSVIADVYDVMTIRTLEQMRGVRVDRISYEQKRPPEFPFELDPYSLEESGRVLTTDEELQLRLLLLDPRSYIGDRWTCGFDAEFAFSFTDGTDRYHILVSRECINVAIIGPDWQRSGNLSREAAQLVRAYCDGLFRFGPVE